jgi:hypothetical protein
MRHTRGNSFLPTCSRSKRVPDARAGSRLRRRLSGGGALRPLVRGERHVARSSCVRARVRSARLRADNASSSASAASSTAMSRSSARGTARKSSSSLRCVADSRRDCMCWSTNTIIKVTEEVVAYSTDSHQRGKPVAMPHAVHAKTNDAARRPAPACALP